MRRLIFLVFVFALNLNLVQAASNNNLSFRARKKIENREKRYRHSSRQVERSKGNRFPSSKSSQSDGESEEFLLDTTVFYVPASGDQYMASLTSDGSDYLAVWIDERTGYNDICAARVSKDGEIMDPAGIFITNGLDEVYYPAVAFDGTNYLMVWEDWRDGTADIYGARISKQGLVLDPNGFVITNNEEDQTYPSIGFDGTNYLVAWVNIDSMGIGNIYATRVSQAGFILDPAGIRLSTQANDEGNAKIAFDGTNYLVIWDYWDTIQGANVCGVRVSQTGVVIDSIAITISTAENDQTYPSIAFDGDNYLVVWEDYRNPDYSEIYGTRVSPEGIVLDTSGIAIATANFDHTPSIAFDGINYLVAWFMETGSEYYQVHCIRVDKMGEVIDPQRKFVMFLTSQFYEEYMPPAVAFAGTNYLVAEERESDDDGYYHIYGALVNSSGDVLDEDGFVISTGGNEQSNSCIAFDGENYLVVWQDGRNIDYSEIYAVRVNQYGIVLDQKGTQIIGINQRYPAIAFNKQNYFVVWGTHQIYGARVSQNGSALDASCFCVTDNGGYPSVAFDGENYLVVWRVHNTGMHNDIIGRRVNQEGVIIDTDDIIITNAARDQVYPKVAFDGLNYLVVWQDDRNERSYPDIYGARISSSGIVLDPEGFLISRLDYKGYRPCVVFDGTNYLVVWREERYIAGTRVSKAGEILDKDYIKISKGEYSASYPALTFDGKNYIVVWPENRRGYGYDIYGAEIDTSGVVIDTFRVSENLLDNSLPAIASDSDNKVLITWSGWTEKINNRPVYANHIWAKIYPFSTALSELRPQVLPNTPNPFNDMTEINYLVYQTGLISIKIYDIKGKKIRDLFNGDRSKGSYIINWDGTDNSKTKLPQGVYICQIKTSAGKTGSRKFIFLK